MKRYSKPFYQGRRLRRMADLAAKSAKMQVRQPTHLPQTQRVDRRLSAETIAQLVQAYRDGASTTELRRRHELSQGSVIKILHEHGVVMRGQGLADGDVSTAAELYRAGATLAQLGERFGVSPNAVRRALVSAGVAMRPRGVSKPRG
jgi:transposase-like protein